MPGHTEQNLGPGGGEGGKDLPKAGAGPSLEQCVHVTCELSEVGG